MLKVGITGGIGTGKSTVCQLFKILNIPIYDADTRAKWLCENNAELVEKIKKLIGVGAYTQDGKYNKAFVAKSIFSNPVLKEKLEKLIHPKVLQDGEEWFETLKIKKKYPYAIKEAALLFETGSAKYLDKIIVVDAPIRIRIQRMLIRGDSTLDEINSRIKNQWPNEEKARLADFVIKNDGLHALIPQVLKIHEKLKVLNQKKN